jgi:hypothetical protein
MAKFGRPGRVCDRVIRVQRLAIPEAVGQRKRAVAKRSRDKANLKLPKRSTKGAYDDQATLEGRRSVPEEY